MPLSPLRLLLVDDDPADIFLTRLAFEQMDALQDIHTAADGLEALTYLRATAGQPAHPDLILLDLNMPGMNGFELLGILKADSQLRRIPVLVFTTSDADADIRESYDRHANSFIRKPSGYGGYEQIVQAVERFWSTCAHLPTRTI